MKRTRWYIGIWICLFLFGTVGVGKAAKLVSPPEGAVYEVGQSYVIRVEPGPGEKLVSMALGFEYEDEGALPDSNGIVEYTVKLPLDFKLGSEKLIVGGILVDQNGKHQEYELSYTITVVLPPTTVVRGIGASFTGDKETFLQVARKASGELVTSGTSKEDRLSVSAIYSDSVLRDIITNPGVKYTSANEKVAIVIPPGQWSYSGGQVGNSSALVRATGPGKTSIIVQYGEFTDRVTVNVKECPYTEGMKRCPR